MSQSSSSAHGVVLVLIAAMLWGTTGTAQSFAPAGMSPLWVGALRLVMAGLFFVLLGRLLRTDSSHRPAPMDWPRMLLCALCMLTYNMAFLPGSSSPALGLALPWRWAPALSGRGCCRP